VKRNRNIGIVDHVSNFFVIGLPFRYCYKYCPCSLCAHFRTISVITPLSDWHSATVPGWHSARLPTLLLVVVCVLLTVGRCNCRQLGVPHSATERSLSQPGTVCCPRYKIQTPCWHSDEWLKLTCFSCHLLT